MKYKKVEVTWVDICGNSGWHNDTKDSDVMGAVASGYLVEKNKRVVKIASMVMEDGTLGHILSFPRGCVKRVRTLK